MIYLDFDGTISCVWNRYYSVFTELTHQSSISLNEYTIAKYELQSDEFLAKKFAITLPEDYFLKKRVLLEKKSYLELDSLLIEPDKIIDFARQNPTRILTLRRNTKNFYQQIEKMGLGILQNQCIVLSPDNHISKADYLRKKGVMPIVMVGDSKGEYDVAENKNAEVFLVSTGLQNPRQFPIRANCHIISDINSFVEMWH